jgi:hypothetical protein
VISSTLFKMAGKVRDLTNHKQFEDIFCNYSKIPEFFPLQATFLNFLTFSIHGNNILIFRTFSRFPGCVGTLYFIFSKIHTPVIHHCASTPRYTDIVYYPKDADFII